MNYREIMTREDIERFEQYVSEAFDKNGSCITWGASCNQHGYPVFWLLDTIHVATRIIYSLVHGEIPDVDEDGEKVVVATTCGNRACMHVPHLYLTTREKAVSASHANGKYDHTRRFGIHHHRTKLSEGAVRHIRKLFAKGEYTQTEIGKLYGVKQHTIAAIINRLTWRHVK